MGTYELTWSGLIAVIESMFDLNGSQIAKRLGVHRSTITNLKKGISWKPEKPLNDWYENIFAPENKILVSSESDLLNLLKSVLESSGYKKYLQDIWSGGKEKGIWRNECEDGDYKKFVLQMLERTRKNPKSLKVNKKADMGLRYEFDYGFNHEIKALKQTVLKFKELLDDADAKAEAEAEENSVNYQFYGNSGYGYETGGFDLGSVEVINLTNALNRAVNNGRAIKNKAGALKACFDELSVQLADWENALGRPASDGTDTAKRLRAIFRDIKAIIHRYEHSVRNYLTTRKLIPQENASLTEQMRGIFMQALKDWEIGEYVYNDSPETSYDIDGFLKDLDVYLIRPYDFGLRGHDKEIYDDIFEFANVLDEYNESVAFLCLGDGSSEAWTSAYAHAPESSVHLPSGVETKKEPLTTKNDIRKFNGKIENEAVDYRQQLRLLLKKIRV